MCLCVAGFRQRSEVVVNPRFTNGFVTPMRLGPPPRSFAPMRMAASWYRSYRIAEYNVAARLLDLRAPCELPSGRPQNKKERIREK